MHGRGVRVWGFALAFACTAGAAAAAMPAEVGEAFKRARIPLGAVSIVVQPAGAGHARLRLNERVPVNPASLIKLATTTAALDLLGPAYSWNTQVWLHGPVVGDTLDGPLVIRGNGDPKLVQERLWMLLRRVRALGVRELRGGIVLDRAAFPPGEGSPALFDGEPFRPYNVVADALLVNYKSILLTFVPDAQRGVAWISAEPPLAGVRVDPSVPLLPGSVAAPDARGGTGEGAHGSSVAAAEAAPCDDWRNALRIDLADPSHVRFLGSYAAGCGEKAWAIAYADPASYNARVVEAIWHELGGTLGAPVRDGSAPAAVPPTFEMPSPPLTELVRDINKFSNNVMAQQLFLTLGLTQRGEGTAEAARDVLNRWLDERFGHDAAGVVIHNGSGLSRDTRVSALLLARLLQWAWASPVMPELMASLPVSGLDGTMKRSKAPIGRAHLKTGSLRDVAGVAGYVLALSGRRYVVVAIVNHANANGPDARAALDALVRWSTDDLVRSR